ncbi:MAG: ferrous iron transport protein B [Candidatus Thorarchaeota archaeon]
MSCHDVETTLPMDSSVKKILIVGPPNVGKSVLFNKLTGVYATVSNYPGTTVGVTQGKLKAEKLEEEVLIIDTPGAYSLDPITLEEIVTQKIVLDGNYSFIIQVMEAKNINRMMFFTLQLMETGVPIIVVLNMMDEVRKQQITINIEKLKKLLSIPVIPTTAITGEGVDELKNSIVSILQGKISKSYSHKPVEYGLIIENKLKQINSLLSIKDGLKVTRFFSLLTLLEDEEAIRRLESVNGEIMPTINQISEEVRNTFNTSINHIITLTKQKYVKYVVKSVMDIPINKEKLKFSDRLSLAMMHPLYGTIILILVVYFGLYWFVGVLGAGEIVDFLENVVFGKYIIPAIDSLFINVPNLELLRSFLIGEYGIISIGISYAVAIILPIVTFFYIIFSIIEDSGYLPRMAMLIDSLFKKIGLSGRAVIPMTLGFGCDTMATVVSRTLETKRERIMMTMLLALAIPCSAQLGVIFAIFSSHPFALLVWAIILVMVFLFVGYLSSRVLLGDQPIFFMEIPPLRIPRVKNVLTKTYTRLVWYFKEVLPLFLIAAVLLWIGDITGVLNIILIGFSPLVLALGLPAEASKIFLYGFFRRDYGAAGLYEMSNILSVNQLLIAGVTLTLFIPCIAQLMVMIKERGRKTAILIILFIFPFAFGIGVLLNIIFTLGGIAF